ncbi:MAG: peptide ABC transporter substrate-binding protein [Clostridia bacterium]|nr:peptide ABC transporter substrate-binding protein [Clostridia bacterium]
MKKLLSLLLAVIMVFALVACTGDNNDDVSNATSTMTLNVGAYPDTIDPALNSAVDGATYIIHNFVGLVGYDANGDLAPMCAAEIPEAVTLENGMTSYTFTLRDGLKWSDGTDLDANDFVYSWNRAANPQTAADYEYMFDVIDGYGTDTLNVTASEDGKQLTVVLPVDVPYFMELCAFPTYMPVKQEVVEANGDAWATKAETYIGNGPYKVSKFTQAELVLAKNEYYWDADSVVTDEIVFAFNDDDSSLLANYKNGSYLFIDSVPQDEIESLEANYPNEYFVEGQLGTYYVSFNVNDPALEGFTEEEKADIRHALGLMIDRNYVCTDIGKAGQVPAAGFVAMGLTEPDGTEFIANNGVNRDGNGYYSVAAEDYAANCAEAVALLEGVAQSSGKFTVENGVAVGFPSLTYITNEGTGHEAVAAYLQAAWGTYGITVNVETQEWATFLNTRKNGDYSVARNGWLGDYNDPISFLDMWITESGNNDSQFGKDAHATYAGYDGKTWAESYDAIIAQVKASKDPEERFELMHQAEDILMQTGAICPIYYYTDIYMCSEKIEGFFSSPLGYKFFMYASVVE